MVLGLEILAAPLLELYLGAQFAPAVPVVRLVMLAAFPHVAYVILRNVLDAVHVRPYNAKNLLLALATFGAVSVAPIAAGAAVPVAVVSGLAILGVLTVRDTLRVLREAALRGPAALGLTLDGRSPVAGGGTEDLVG
jgi:O-antigen/teichoic acid export membrane protein